MRQAILGRLTLLILIALITLIPPSPRSPAGGRTPDRDARLRAGVIPMSLGTEDDADAQAEMEFMMLRDPMAGIIPRDIHRRELRFARALPVRSATSARIGPTQVASIQPLVWTERGPNNVGGRTRVFAVDVSNPTTLLAGSVAGGIWRSTDQGASWSLRTAPGQIHSTSCIAQDKRIGKTATWYVGTGEIRGSTTNATRWGSLYLGDGIFKSTDSGQSWALLPSTVSGTPQVTDPFDYVIDVATNPANPVQDEVLAATFKGIYRSTDGGGSWTTAIPSDSGLIDVAVTPAGVMYASTRVANLQTVWRSTNGTTWTDIRPVSFPTTANRIVIGLAPSNPLIAYFFVQGTSTAPQVNGHQLWKYTYVSGDGSGVGGVWENRGGNLPSDLNTQAGYDQVIHVKPDDDQFIIIGGQNLYRSTNGFTSTAATTVIGGYSFYPAGHHHPDLHAGGFDPATPAVYYSAGDGGISRAADITLPSMVWTSLDHGYNVTQFYSVAIAPDVGSNVILAGAQDNGSQLGTAPGASDWVQAYGGDGTVVAVSPAAQDRLYTQYQGGQAQRQNWDGSNLTDITPSGALNQMFVNPIALDPNNPLLLYYAGGNTGTSSMIWRNDDAPVATTTFGWTALTATNVGAGSGYARTISAIGLSKANTPNVMYYGTVDGIVKKAVNIHTATPTVTDITPPGLNGGTATGGFVRCVAVDPTDSNKALVAFGNYNFQSLWYTVDGGANWSDVEGNLAGASGPSIRWATMFYFDGLLHVFLGTSIGVLSTNTLAGGSTVWAQEATNEIGNVIVGYMDYRDIDHTLAVATHGRGAFTTQFLQATGIADGRPDPARNALLQSYPNPAQGEATIAYDLPREARVSLRVFDVTGREVAVLVNGPEGRGHHEARLAAGRLEPGAYYYALKAEGAIATRRLLVIH